MIGRSGRLPLRIRSLTAVRGFRAWLARESLRRGCCRLGCCVLPPWHRCVVLSPEPLRRLQDLAGQGVGLVSLAQGETEALGGLEHLPQAGLRRRDGCIRQVRLAQGGPPSQPERMPCRGRTEQEPGPGPGHLVPEGGSRRACAPPGPRSGSRMAAYVTEAPATLASLPSLTVFTPWFVIRCFVIRACGVPLIIIPHRGVIAVVGLQGLQL